MICSDNVVSLQGNTYKMMHAVCSVICWLLPWIPVGIVLGSKSTSYGPINMRVCFPVGSGGTGFFTTTFITGVSQGVSCTCLFFVVYKLFMVIINQSFALILKLNIIIRKECGKEYGILNLVFPLIRYQIWQTILLGGKTRYLKYCSSACPK